MNMKLYMISQEENNDDDTYSDAVVAAPDELTARNMHPCNGEQMTGAGWAVLYSVWCSSIDHVIVKYLGDATDGIEQGVICASFHAG